MSTDYLFHAGEATVLAKEGQFTDAMPEILIGRTSGPVGQAFANMMAQSKGHTTMFAIRACNQLVRPATMMVPKVTLKDMANIELGFAYKDFFEMQPSTGYETLIYDCLTGDQTLFQRADNIENGWRAVQPFLDAWKEDASVQAYKAGEDGPEAGSELLARDGREWHSLG